MKKILNNSKTKMIISLCLAFLLWFYVAIILNPEIEVVIRDIPVVYSDMRIISDRNLTLINDQEMTINVRLRGERRTLKQINNKNITALIDLQEYTTPGEYEIPVSIKLPVEGVTLISKTQQSFKVTVDNIAVATVDVKLNVTGTPKSGYVHTNELVSVERAEIKGPQSIVKTVSYVQATLDVSGSESSKSALSDLELMSANDVKIESDLVEINPSKVEAMCTVGYAKTVKVVVPVTNNADKRVTASPVNYKEVTLVGKKSYLEKIDKIETTSIDASYYYYPAELELDLKLPDDVLTQSGMKSVMVQVDVVKD